ncbi:MAG: NAD-dependent epimerase/dehydratase family protein [Planctomycetota bacterium]
MTADSIFVTGATGLVGTRFCRVATQQGYSVHALVRPGSNRDVLADVPVTFVEGDLGNPESFAEAMTGCNYVVHSAAHIGDWGPAETYRDINVRSLRKMLQIVLDAKNLKRWIQISSLGVYPARDHHGTDESTPADLTGLDGYTQTKAEAEGVIHEMVLEQALPAVILRPGFIYGPGERYAIPRVLKRLAAGQLKIIGPGTKVLNNTYVGNLTDAIVLALVTPDIEGETFNIRDERLVSRVEYFHTITDYMGTPHPKHIPLWVGKMLAGPIETLAKLRGATESPLLTRATMKFMTLNLDYSIEKAKRRLGYQPRVDFRDGIIETLDDMTGTTSPS